MTLIEIANQICSITGLTDNLSVEEAKKFIRNRWKMIWDSNLWRQSRTAIILEVSKSQADIVLPNNFAQVTGAKLEGYHYPELLPFGDEFAFQSSPDSFFEREEYPRYFQQLPKVDGILSVRILPVPDKTYRIHIIGKSKVTELLNDYDEPQISGVDNALLAYAMGDMFKYMRQFTKANNEYAEGAAHLSKMVEIEKAQSASCARLIPAIFEDVENFR